VKEITLQDRLMGEFRAAKGLKARIGVASEILKNAADLTDIKAAATEVITALNAEIVTHQRTQPAVALEGNFIPDDLREAAKLPAAENELTTKSIWSQDAKLGVILEIMPAIKHRRTLDSFKEANPDRWVEIIRATLNVVPAKLCRECAHLLIHEGKI